MRADCCSADAKYGSAPGACPEFALLFCEHHFGKHKRALAAAGWWAAKLKEGGPG